MCKKQSTRKLREEESERARDSQRKAKRVSVRPTTRVRDRRKWKKRVREDLKRVRTWEEDGDKWRKSNKMK